MTEYWKAIVLGVVQGLTEFLPISSSAHLIAFKELLGFEAPLAFDVALHLATLAAVVIYFRRDLARLTFHEHRVRLLGIIALATIPGATLGYVLGSWRDGISVWWVVAGWTFSAAYLLASRGRGGEGAYTGISWWRGLLIGSAQALAIFPGVSRSGSSIVSGLWLGLERDAACRFSFLLSMPLIAGAGLKKALDLAEEGTELLGWPLAVSMLCSFLVGLGAIHVLLGIVRSDKIHRFGWYNLAAAVAFSVFLLVGRSN